MKENINENSLIFLFKKGDYGAFIKLEKLYRVYSKRLAGDLLSIFKHSTKAEFEDLVALGVEAIIPAIKAYKGDKGFYTYWKKIAFNMMMSEITKFSVSFRSNYQLKFVSIEDINPDEIIASPSASDDIGASLLYSQIIKEIRNPRNGINEENQDIFIEFLQGKTIKELAIEKGMTYFAMRRRISVLKDKIIHILHNSKE